jgi:hypothetical protein
MRFHALTLASILLGVAAPPLRAATPLAVVNISSCVNTSNNIGQPVGAALGNTPKKFAKLGFTLLDPGKGNNLWVGGASAELVVKLAVPSPTAVFTLMNTYYGQSGIHNATVTFEGTGGVTKTFALIGNKTVRDYNNYIWTNTVNGTTAEEWWTNNLNPQPDDQSHRLDAQEFNFGTAFSGKTLTKIIISAPKSAAVNYLEPILFAIDVSYPGATGTVASTCSVVN